MHRLNIYTSKFLQTTIGYIMVSKLRHRWCEYMPLTSVKDNPIKNPSLSVWEHLALILLGVQAVALNKLSGGHFSKMTPSLSGCCVPKQGYKLEVLTVCDR